MEVVNENLEEELQEDVVHPVQGSIMIDPKSGSGEETNRAQPCSAQSSSFYTMSCDQSLMSGQVERWMGGVSPIQTTGIQGSRPTMMQRSTLAPDAEPPLGTRMWCTLALLVPLLHVTDVSRWRCSQNTFLNFMELISAQLVSAASRMRCNIRSLAQSHITREIFATLLDVVLVFYAIGFLILSVYQAAIIY